MCNNTSTDSAVSSEPIEIKKIVNKEKAKPKKKREKKYSVNVTTEFVYKGKLYTGKDKKISAGAKDAMLKYRFGQLA